MWNCNMYAVLRPATHLAPSSTPLSLAGTCGTMERQCPTLLDFVRKELERNAYGKRDFLLTVVRSKPRRSHSLFPYASDLSVNVFVEEVLLVLAERPQHPFPVAPQVATDDPSVTPTPPYVPVVALEAYLYSVPSTRTCLLYISKVDTSGLLTSRPPARIVCTAFLSYHMLFPPRDASTVRIHVFARADSQYMFPDSASNPGKRILSDKELSKWWRGVFSTARRDVVSGPAHPSSASDVRLYYLVPGYSADEAERLAPSSNVCEEAKWQYGHPYTPQFSPVLPSTPRPSHEERCGLHDLIPCFTDDPKSRFINSLASSALSPAGEPGDHDETLNSISSMSAASAGPRRELLEKDRERERARVKGIGIDEFWERMGWRQECCSGAITTFLVAVASPRTLTPAQPSDDIRLPTEKDGAEPRPNHGSIDYSTFVSLWGRFHNAEYKDVQKVQAGFNKWIEDVEAVVSREGFTESDANTSNTASTAIVVENVQPGTEKRKADFGASAVQPAAPVTLLQARKKRKVEKS